MKKKVYNTIHARMQEIGKGVAWNARRPKEKMGKKGSG